MENTKTLLLQQQFELIMIQNTQNDADRIFSHENVEQYVPWPQQASGVSYSNRAVPRNTH